VDAVIARAAALGHVGLSDRATAEIALGRRAPAAVNAWVRAASAELDRFEASSGVIADADVVDESSGVGPEGPGGGGVGGPVAQDAEVSVPAASDENLGGGPAPTGTDKVAPAAGSVAATAASDSGPAPREVDVESLRRRLAGLLDLQDERGAEDEGEVIAEEIAEVEAALRAVGGDMPGQGALL
jgi:hypothetical protein